MNHLTIDKKCFKCRKEKSVYFLILLTIHNSAGGGCCWTGGVNVPATTGGRNANLIFSKILKKKLYFNKIC